MIVLPGRCIICNSGIARAACVTASGKRLIVLHVFVKKTQKTPLHAIETALVRLKELEP